ncbi:uncharacterized protein KRP23_5389 [Phytophthora ramorum]|uniref:uncharacterized protein n=1 Tax=Phytophthora ramorum TaxID=164328 RepID=UPI00309DE599|nr:hypothetical protein KRP23_5389 [Phytophthora ramorum]
MHWIATLCVLCIAWCGAFAAPIEEIEVALGVDGSVVDENRPVASAFSAKSEEMQPQSTAAIPESVNLQDNVAAVMTTLQQELTAVEGMVKLQEKKLQILETMRTAWLQEMHMQQNTEVRRRAKVDVAQVIERRLDTAIAEHVAELHDFDEVFVERAAMELQRHVADVKMVKIRATSAVELIAVAYTDGLVVFSTSAGEELLRIRTERQGLKSIALALQDDQPCVVVTFEAPAIALYALNLIEKSHGVERDTDTTQPFTISTGPEYLLSVGEQQDVQMSAPATAVAIARSSRQLVVAVAQVDGVIDFLALNGTSLRQMKTNAVISAMETRRNLLAFSNGTYVVVSSMTRAQGSIYHTCPGSSAGVSSIAFDAVHPDIMYAGTYRGEVLVYAVNAGAPADGQGCRLLSRSTLTKRPRELTPVALATTRTYVVATGPQDITVFNVSISQKIGVSLSRVCTNHLDKRVDLQQDLQSNHGATLLAMAFSEGILGSHLALLTANSDGLNKLVLFHSLLPNEREVPDSQWTMFLYAGTVIVAVVGSQLFIRWQRQSSVNPWDSIGKTHDKPYGKYGGLKGNESVSGFDGEDFGRYNSLSDELRRKITQAKRETTHRPIDDEADY